MAWFTTVCLVLFASLSNAVTKLPVTPQRPIIDEYHKVKVIDNYRWLENSESEEVNAWTKAQSQYAREYLNQVPYLSKIKAKLKKWAEFKSPKYYSVFSRAGVYFALKDMPPKNQPILLRLKSIDNLTSAKTIFDPNEVDPTGKTAINFYDVSFDGKYLAISLSKDGSEVGSMHLYNIQDGTKLPDIIPNVQKPTAGGDVAWLADSSGFFYTRYPKAGERPEADLNFYQQIYYHKIGTSVDSDTYVLGKEFPRIAEIQLGYDPEGRYLLATVSDGDGGDHAFYLRNPKGEWKTLCGWKDGVKSVRLGFGDDLFFILKKNNPKGVVLKTTLSKPDFKSARIIIPESDAVIESLVTTKSRLFTTDLIGGPSQIRMFDLNGTALGSLKTEPFSTVNGLTRLNDESIIFSTVSYIRDAGYWLFDPLSKEATNLKPTPTKLTHISPVNLNDIEVKREFATSKDGTKIPVNILFKRGTKLNGKNPTLLYGYGGYGINMQPYFSTNLRLWFDHGGVYAVANLRGGGEFGEEWHLKGNLANKQNVFDDFIAAAEYLIQTQYTSPQYLAIEGRSNGGLLMGAVMTQRPELFRAVVSGVGIYDMLRVELDPNGAFNITEFGTVKDADQFKALYNYSPFHRVKDGTAYPAIFLSTGANDGRVNPMQSKKMAARLQAASTSKEPILLLVDFGGGHGMGHSRDQWVSDQADKYAFLFHALGMKW